MSEEKAAPDLFDLKFLPAWVKEAPNENPYANFAGEENGPTGPHDRRNRDRSGGDRRERGPRSPRAKEGGRDPRERERRPGSERGREPRRREEPIAPPPVAEVRFVPAAPVLESVVAQIKAGHLAYSVFSLGRMFLDKPERYDVRLKAETAALFQLGENGPVASDQHVLENGAFHSEKDNFYLTEVTQSEPIKGNFTSVARCRLSGVLLGPTNHHAYQPQLRNLYEQRFSRRMSFSDYQRQIQIVTDPAEIEKWKEDARKVTMYSTLREETPVTFSSATETERHFQQNYLPDLIRTVSELVIDGPASRHLHDRVLNRLIENEWTSETRSPSPMMQELAARFREAGLHVFRHRRGMLFVSSIYPRAFKHPEAGVSVLVRTILDTIGAAPGIGRKELADKLIVDLTGEEAERAKLSLASDLRWLINEGYVIEFNDGSLDLPRGRAKPQEVVAAVVSTAEPTERALGTSASTLPAGEKTPDELVGLESPPS